MTENFRAVIVVLGLSIPMLLFLRPHLTAMAIAPRDFRIRAGLWVALSIALFVSHNFWLFVLIVAVAVLTVGRKDSNPLGLYFFLLLLAPPFPVSIPGIGGIAYFLFLDYLRLLSLLILLPYAVRLARDPLCPGLFKLPADKYLIGYLLLQLAIQSTTTTTTDAIRWATSLAIDVFLPYYAFSRGLSDREKMQDAFAAFVAACSVLALIALFETLKGWLLYSSLPNFFGVNWGMGGYMMRNDTLRATASTGHSITLGFVLTVALGLHLSLRSYFHSGRAWTLILIVLGAGILATMSRGPWVGAAALVLTALALSPARASNFAKLGLASVFVVPAMLFSPFGGKIIAVLPFIGTVSGESVDFRQQLFNISWDILMLNPLFGSPDYLGNASIQSLAQGDEAMIDVVNSYLAVAMYSGFVGLALFAGVFASSVIGLLRRLAGSRGSWGVDHEIGLALLATLVGVLVAIATLSSINATPVVYWCLAGACTAFLQRVASSARPDEPLPERATPPVHAMDVAGRAGYSPRRG